MSLTELAVDEGPHNMDGLLLHARDGSQRVEAFISRWVMDSWVDPVEPCGRRKSLLRAQYNALGKRNLAAIERIVTLKYQRGAAFNRQHPFVDVLFSDITESSELLDVSEPVRAPSLPAFERVERSMRTHRFGMKIKLPATLAIKHQIRTRMAQYETEKAEAEERDEASRGQPREELVA
jgi:hypothetical protein